MKANLDIRLSILQSDLTNLRDCLRERGVGYFQRPIALGLFLVFAAYYFVYKSPEKAQRLVNQELSAVQATLQYAGTYKDMKERLQILSSMLPKGPDTERWLLESIRESLRQEAIVPISFSPPKEAKVEGYRFISITVTCEASYRQLASWVARLERGEALMYVEKLKLDKKTKQIGINTAEVTITTAIQQEGAARS